MYSNIPDYFIALMKQKAGLLNDQQTARVVRAISQALNTSLTPAQANKFFAATPAYLRPSKQSFFTSIGNWQKPVSNKSVFEQLLARLQLTDPHEAEVLLGAYFGAIRTIVAREVDLKISLVLPKDLGRFYVQAPRG